MSKHEIVSLLFAALAALVFGSVRGWRFKFDRFKGSVTPFSLHRFHHHDPGGENERLAGQNWFLAIGLLLLAWGVVAALWL